MNETIRKQLRNYEEDIELFENVSKPFFFDDFIWRERSIEKAFELSEELKEHFLEGHVVLRK